MAVRIFIGFFGLARALDRTIDSIEQKIFAPLLNENIEIVRAAHLNCPRFIHSSRSGETMVKYTPQKSVGLMLARKWPAVSATSVDTDGRLLIINLTAADISDGTGIRYIVAAIRKRWPWLEHLFADGTHDRTRLMEAAAYLEIVRGTDKEPGLKILPKC